MTVSPHMTDLNTTKHTPNDTTANVSYKVLAHGKTVAKTVVVSEHCNVDLDAEGYPIGIETI